jgi:hypothetical protein
MIFPYLDVTRGEESRPLPIIPVRLLGPVRQATLLALVDSGAEHSVMSKTLVEYLGLSTQGAKAVRIVGVGGMESTGVLLDVELQLGRCRWTAPAVFSNAVDSPIILGQAGFFAFYTVTFKRRHFRMDIRRAR